MENAVKSCIIGYTDYLCLCNGEKMIKTQHKKIIAFVFLFLLIFQLSLMCLTVSAEGSEATVYSNAINDLRRSTSFDESQYPKLSSSHEQYYSLEVITIAESEDDELFVYVYQPSGDAGKIKASHISIARSERNVNVDDVDADGVGKFEVYTLTYLNNYKQFYKYKVDDLEVSSEATRYYEISDILRPFNKEFGDKDPGAGNTVSAVPYAVGKLFTFTGTPGERSSLSVKDMEYITITEKYVGFIRYEKDLPIFASPFESSATDCHFVAFSTDKQIDNLLEADLFYQTQSFESRSAAAYTESWGEIVDAYAYLDFEQMGKCEVSDGSVFTSEEYIFHRIQTTSQFVTQEVPYFLFPGFNIGQNLEFDAEAKAALAKTQWVLCFEETPYNRNFIDGNTPREEIDQTYVGNVKILRLKFETDGKIYDLGVVDNMQTGSKDPAAVVEQQDWWQKIMMVLMLLVLLWALTFLAGPIGFVFKIIWKGIKLTFKFLVWLLSRPWAIFRWLLGFLDKKQSPKQKKKGN